MAKIAKQKELETVDGGRSLDGYGQLLKDIKSILQQGLSKAYKAVDNLKVQTYWQVGERIVREEFIHKERADYGKSLIKNLVNDLGIAERNLHNSIRFYRIYPILQTVSAQLSWSHLVELMYVDDREERMFYEQQAIHNMWSVRELREQMQNNLYVRAKREGKLTITMPVPVEPAIPEKVFKDAYNFDFLDLKENHTEADLEHGMVSNTEKVILEFGFDFSLSGRQRKIIIDGQAHLVDLEFYHRGIPCIILVELKIGNFKSEYVGQMNKYLNWYRENKKYSWEKEPIGLIICQSKAQKKSIMPLAG